MPNTSLGQHWLSDRSILESIVTCASLPDRGQSSSRKGAGVTVLEIGPGLGTLTSVLLRYADQVIAVEFDSDLARKLPGQFPGKNLVVYQGDILSFDLTKLPREYAVVANVPYYITSKIIQLLSESTNPPSRSVLLVQKEVAERLAAGPGGMSLLAISAQVFHDVSLGPVVLRDKFMPPPKVDSQVVIFRRRETPLVPADQQKAFFRVVKAGFSSRRKKLRSSLAAGLAIGKSDAEAILNRANISPDARAQELSIRQWLELV